VVTGGTPSNLNAGILSLIRNDEQVAPEKELQRHLANNIGSE
jgi:hypothetical protein